MDAQGLLQIATRPQDVRNLALRDRTQTHIAQSLVHRKLVLAPDAQGLLQLASRLQDVRNLALRDSPPFHIAQAINDREYLVAVDAQGLLQLAARPQDVRNLALRHRTRTHIAEALEHRQHVLAQYAQGLLQLATRPQDVRNRALRDRTRTHVAQSLVHRKLVLSPDAQGLLQLAARLQYVRDIALRDRNGVIISAPSVQRQLPVAPVRERIVIVAQGVVQQTQFVERRDQQFVVGIGISVQPLPDLGNSAMALGHAAGIDIRNPVRRMSRLRPQQCSSRVFPRGRCRYEGIHAAAPRPQIRRTARRGCNGLCIQPEHQPPPRLGGDALTTNVEGVPTCRIEPAARHDDMHHIGLPGMFDEAGFEGRHIRDAATHRQPAAAQFGYRQHLVQRRHHPLAQPLVAGIHQQPLERWAMDERARQALEVVETVDGENARGLEAPAVTVEARSGHRRQRSNVA